MLNISMEKITSRNNAKIIEASKLKDKKYRDTENVFFIEGIKLFKEALENNAEFVRIFYTEDAVERYYGDINRVICEEKYLVSNEVFEKITNENAPQGIFAILKYYTPKSECKLKTNFTIVLDEISDPGNLGTIIRCADAMGVDCVYIGDNGVDLYNPKTVRACMGSLFRVKTVRTKATDAVIALKEDGYRVYAAILDENAVDVRTISHEGKISFVIGNEGRGASKEVVSLCTGSIIIPMKENVNSLNAAMAASVLMWEISRERI